MPRNWLQIRVELLTGLYAECDPAPGRVFLVGPRHTFEQLAQAINLAFARWDLSHLHSFELPDGRRATFTEHDLGGDEDEIVDHATARVLDYVGPGDRFGFTFDFGDEWMHACEVERDKVDPLELAGTAAIREPLPIFGWGTIPDQYGREVDDRDLEGPAFREPPFPYLHDELVRILTLHGRPMTSRELADTINAEGRYHRHDGSAVSASQISARINKYPRLFDRDDTHIRRR